MLHELEELMLKDEWLDLSDKEKARYYQALQTRNISQVRQSLTLGEEGNPSSKIIRQRSDLADACPEAKENYLNETIIAYELARIMKKGYAA